jgi:hypothetical protein
MSLTQLETVETELKRTKYGQNKAPKLTGLKDGRVDTKNA